MADLLIPNTTVSGQGPFSIHRRLLRGDQAAQILTICWRVGFKTESPGWQPGIPSCNCAEQPHRSKVCIRYSAQYPASKERIERMTALAECQMLCAWNGNAAFKNAPLHGDAGSCSAPEESGLN